MFEQDVASCTFSIGVQVEHERHLKPLVDLDQEIRFSFAEPVYFLAYQAKSLLREVRF